MTKVECPKPAPAGRRRHVARRASAALAAGLLLTAQPLAAEPAKVVIGVSSRSFNPGFSNMWIGIALGLYGKDLAPEVGRDPGCRRESTAHAGRSGHHEHRHPGRRCSTPPPKAASCRWLRPASICAASSTACRCCPTARSSVTPTSRTSASACRRWPMAASLISNSRRGTPASIRLDPDGRGRRRAAGRRSAAERAGRRADQCGCRRGAPADPRRQGARGRPARHHEGCGQCLRVRLRQAVVRGPQEGSGAAPQGHGPRHRRHVGKPRSRGPGELLHASGGGAGRYARSTRRWRPRSRPSRCGPRRSSAWSPAARNGATSRRSPGSNFTELLGVKGKVDPVGVLHRRADREDQRLRRAEASRLGARPEGAGHERARSRHG